jgi:hypothetical protein
MARRSGGSRTAVSPIRLAALGERPWLQQSDQRRDALKQDNKPSQGHCAHSEMVARHAVEEEGDDRQRQNHGAQPKLADIRCEQIPPRSIVTEG